MSLYRPMVVRPTPVVYSPQVGQVAQFWPSNGQQVQTISRPMVVPVEKEQSTLPIAPLFKPRVVRASCPDPR